MTNYFNTYNNQEFMPIYIEGKLANRNEFIIYKAGKIGNKLINALDKAYYAVGGR